MRSPGGQRNGAADRDSQSITRRAAMPKRTLNDIHFDRREE